MTPLESEAARDFKSRYEALGKSAEARGFKPAFTPWDTGKPTAA